MERPTTDISLVMISFDRLFVKHQNKNYLRYLEKYTHNLKNPLIQRYQERSCEAFKAMPKQEKKMRKENGITPINECDILTSCRGA